MMQQPRSQPSQQSFSQGFSSQQNGIFSQISQNSVDEVLTDNQVSSLYSRFFWFKCSFSDQILLKLNEIAEFLEDFDVIFVFIFW